MDRLPTERIAQLEDSTESIRAMSLEERGEMLAAACQAAIKIEQGRLASGLPPSQPAPWPESTWELLRKYAPNAREREGSG